MITDKQITYAKYLQTELRSLSPLGEQHKQLAAMQINSETDPKIINKLREAILYEEYLEDSAYTEVIVMLKEGHFMQD